jgi:hypothetical protein
MITLPNISIQYFPQIEWANRFSQLVNPNSSQKNDSVHYLFSKDLLPQKKQLHLHSF